MKVKKSLLLLVLIVVFVLVGCSKGADTNGNAPAPSNDQVYTIVFTNSGSEQAGLYKGAVAMKEYVEKESNGKIKMELYMNSQIGNDREGLESVQTGSATMTITGLTQYTNFVQDLVALDQPFLYEDAEQVNALFSDEEVVVKLNEMFGAANYKYLGMNFQGFRTLTSNRKVEKPADLKGMSIRVIESPTPLALWKALGASPTPLSFAEVYTALQQGVVEAQENPIELIASQKFYEQQKYIIDTNHQIQPLFWVVNPDFYNNLPADLQKVFDDGFQQALKATDEATATDMEKYNNTIKEYGSEFIAISDESRAEFKDLTSGVRADIEKQFPDFTKVINDALGRIK